MSLWGQTVPSDRLFGCLSICLVICLSSILNLFFMLVFRHTLWRHLQDILSPLLARVLEVLDRDCNLDLLYGLSEGLVQFWLDIFQDQQLLDLPFSHNARYFK